MSAVASTVTGYRERLMVDAAGDLQTKGNQQLLYVWDPVALQWVRMTQPGTGGKTLKTKDFSLSSTGTVVASVAAHRLKVYGVKLVTNASASVNFRDGGATNLEGAQAITANGGYVETIDPPAFLFATTAGNSLDLVVTGGGTAAGRVSYWDDDTT